MDCRAGIIARRRADEQASYTLCGTYIFPANHAVFGSRTSLPSTSIIHHQKNSSMHKNLGQDQIRHGIQSTHSHTQSMSWQDQDNLKKNRLCSVAIVKNALTGGLEHVPSACHKAHPQPEPRFIAETAWIGQNRSTQKPLEPRLLHGMTLGSMDLCGVCTSGSGISCLNIPSLATFSQLRGFCRDRWCGGESFILPWNQV